jgi:hypothetical protein
MMKVTKIKMMEEHANPNEDFDLYGSLVESKCSLASFVNCFSNGTDGSEMGGFF